jgi:hypothetical protein
VTRVGWRRLNVLEVVGIDHGPADALDQPSGEVVRLEIERTDPLAE